MARIRLSMTAIVVVLWFAPWPIAVAADASASANREDTATLHGHEPTLLGWTYDGSGHGYMDFTLSAKFPLFPKWIRRGISENSALYFAFTGRFGQYFDRNSSPVIGKRYNPELFYRLRRDSGAYFDVGYAHESNGQSINSLAAYQQAQLTLERPEYADDYISRGWDYVHLGVRSPRYPGFTDSDRTQAYLTFKRFLDGGVLQGRPEEYNSWENNPQGKPRDQVDGVSAMLKYVHRSDDAGEALFSDWKFAVIYTTGYREIFRYNSVRLEAGIKILELPVIVWTSRGYNSDLVRYYKKLNASGIAVEIGAF